MNFFLKKLRNCGLAVLLLTGASNFTYAHSKKNSPIAPSGLSENMSKSKGSVSGTIKDTKGQPLPYASVVIKEINSGTPTDVNGNFKLADIPEGNYTLVVSFLGYKSTEKEISVVANQTTKVQITLNEEQTNLSETVVYGNITRGQASALNQQKNAGNIQNVVSSEQFSKFPDRNAAEVVSRIPAVSVDYDQGEGQNVLIRGLSPDYNSLTINGERIPNSDNDNTRGVGLDLLNQNLIESIEVIKAITPDMEGDAIGGSVNFKMKEASDSLNLSIDAGAGYNPQHSEFETYGKDIMNFSVFGDNRFFNKKLGVLIGGSYYKTNIGSMMAEYDRYEGDYGLADTIYAQHTNDYDVKRQRYGFLANIDYKFNDFNKLYISTNCNYYFDNEIRRKVEYSMEDGVEDGTETRETRNRGEYQRLYNYSLGGENQINKIKIDYLATYMKASFSMPDRTYWRYARDMDYSKYTNNEVKEFSANTALESDNTLTLNRLRCDNFHNNDKDISFRANATIPFNIKNSSNSFKFGGKYMKKDVDHNPIRTDYKKFEDPYTIEAGQFGMVDVRFTDIDIDNLNASKISEGESQKQEKYEGFEGVTAGYGMFTFNFSPKITLLGGARVEHTHNKYQSLYTGDDNLNRNEISSDYTNVLPSVHFTYKPTDKMNVRLAYSTGISRPEYDDLVPVEIEDDSETPITIDKGNPDLKATTSNNFDFMFERYTNYLGFLSAGVFYKDLSNIIADKTTTTTEDDVKYKITQPVNRNNATVYGAEFAFNQRLKFIPGSLFNNLSLYGNYTYTHSKYEVDGRELVLCGSPKNIFNLALMYDNPKKGWSFVISNLYRGAILYEEGDDKYTDYYYGAEYHLDLSVSKKIGDKLNVLVQLKNLTDQWMKEYEGDPSKDYSYELEWEKYNGSGLVTLQYKF